MNFVGRITLNFLDPKILKWVLVFLEFLFQIFEN
jgi:hypothetical protein